MGKSIANKTKMIFGLLLGATLVVAFQNCAIPVDFGNFESKANGNGTGYDGKVYANHGTCGTSTGVQLKSTFEILEDGSAAMTRENCADLPTPVPVPAPALRPSGDDPNVIVYGNDVYDFYDADPTKRKLTRAICWMTSGTGKTEVKIWSLGDIMAGGAGALTLYGSVINTNGGTTGVLSPVSETYSVNQVRWVASDTSGNRLDLTMYPGANYGQMTYKTSGVLHPTTSSTDCHVQALK